MAAFRMTQLLVTEGGLTAYDKGDTVNGCMCMEILDEKHQIISSLLYQRDLHA